MNVFFRFRIVQFSVRDYLLGLHHWIFCSQTSYTTNILDRVINFKSEHVLSVWEFNAYSSTFCIPKSFESLNLWSLFPVVQWWLLVRAVYINCLVWSLTLPTINITDLLTVWISDVTWLHFKTGYRTLELSMSWWTLYVRSSRSSSIYSESPPVKSFHNWPFPR